MHLTIGILAGEPSGDNLGAGLMRAMRAQADPSSSITFVGIGGPKMLAEGLHSLAPIDQLAVNGFRDPIMRLPSLIRLLRQLISDFSARRVDAFVGIDFNVFNFLLERALKRRGCKTIHYVSPSVYAWRSGRTRRVEKSADLLLCLYPFEPGFYRHTKVRAVFVGHPLADEITPAAGSSQARAQARQQLDVPERGTVLAVLPGSRNSEVQLMIPSFLHAAELFSADHDGVSVVIPCLRPELRGKIETALVRHPRLAVKLYDGNARLALTAADVVLVKSGTSTLEALLVGRPMVVSYRLGWLTYQFARRVLRTPYVALPNILAGRALVPELLQDAGTGPALSHALGEQLRIFQQAPQVREKFARLGAQLRLGADEKAAAAVLGLVHQSGEQDRVEEENRHL